MFTSLTTARNALVDVVRDFDAGTLSPGQAVRVVKELGEIQRCIDAITAMAARRVSDTDAAQIRGARSADALVAKAMGCTTRAARDAIEQRRSTRMPPKQLPTSSSAQLRPRVSTCGCTSSSTMGTLTGRYVSSDPVCEIAGVGPVDPDWVRSLLGSAFRTAVVKKGKDITTVAHLGRYVPVEVETALVVQGHECSIKGCGLRGYLERDHTHDFAKGGPTSLDNLGWLCGYHHQLKTRGWVLGPPDPRTGKCDLSPPRSRGLSTPRLPHPTFDNRTRPRA